MAKTIWVSTGAQEYVGGSVTEITGEDISTATLEVGLSTSPNTPPDDWATPDVDEEGTTTSSRVVKLLVTDTTELGTYYCWVRVSDIPEIAPRCFLESIIVK